MMLEQIVSRLGEYEVILEPDEDTPAWWAGAPSVARGEDGTFYLAARMREGRSPLGRRGYEIRLLRSDDGRRFEVVHRIPREKAGVQGFERPALIIDGKTGAFRLYGCARFEKEGWSILRFDDAESLEAIDPASCRPVLSADPPDPMFCNPEGYKDPFIFRDGDRWRMFTIGFERVERVHHFESDDGDSWRRAGDWPVMENAGWHNCYTRPACLVPMALGYLFVYEGSNLQWRDPAYNIATGLAYTPDLSTFLDLTPGAPLLKSTTPGDYHTWRYSHWLTVGDRVYAYFEAARPNNTNEIRLGVFEASFAR